MARRGIPLCHRGDAELQGLLDSAGDPKRILKSRYRQVGGLP